MLPLRRVSVRPEHDPGSWYWQLPAIGQLPEKGLDLGCGVTVPVGENGSGSSTLVEAIAAAWRGRLTGAEVTHWGPVRTPDDEGRPGYTDLVRPVAAAPERVVGPA